MSLIVDGSRDYYDALMGTTVTPSLTNFLNDSLNTFSQRLADGAQDLYQRAYSLYDSMMGDQSLRQAQIIRNNFDDVWSDSSPAYLPTIDMMQEARLISQRYIMVNPLVRQYYYDDRVEGYAGSYRDPYPDVPTEEHSDYKRVLNGVLQVDEEEDTWHYVTYLDEYLSDEAPLDVTEQANILDTWKCVEAYLKRHGRDPVSLWNADID